MKRILGLTRKCVERYELINDGDKIGVGVSGGKDSMTLLYALKQYQNFSKAKYELEAFTIDLGYEDFDTKPIEDFCNRIQVPLNIKKTDIKEIVFDIRKEKNPCSLCAKLRRGAIHNSIKERGFNKLALGHHSDDAIDTFFLSLFYEGRMYTLPTSSYLDRKDITVIRPFLYVEEKDIISAVNRHNIPISKNPCEIDKKTKREEIHLLLNGIYKEIPSSREKVFTALKNINPDNFWI